MTNEITNFDSTTGEILPMETIIQDNEKFTIVKLADGKFEKRMKYKRVHTSIPQTEEETLKLYKVLNESDNGIVVEMKKAIGKKLVIKNFYTEPYESFNEETGENTRGVSSVIEAVDGTFYGTSSKTVYYALMNLYDVFTDSLTNGKIEVEITGTKREQGEQIGLSVIGLVK